MARAIVSASLVARGAEKIASLLSLNLNEKPYLVLFDGSKIDYPYGGELIDFGIRTILNRRSLVRFKDTLTASYKLRKIKKKLNIEVSISFLELANIPNIISGFSKNIVSVREYRLHAENENFQRRLANLAIRLLYNKASKIVVVSNLVKQNLISAFNVDPKKIKVIYNPIDFKTVEKLQKEPLEDRHKSIFAHPVIITAGGMEKGKGQWHIIKAFKEIKKQVVDAQLVIIGKEGGIEKDLARLARDLGLEKDVHILGSQRNPYKFLAASALFAFASSREGFPNVLLDALACGIPIISTDCRSGPREILAPDTDFTREAQTIERAKYGVLVPVCDREFKGAEEPLSREEKMIAEISIEFLKDPGLRKRYSELGMERAEDFRIERFIRDWEGLIDEVSVDENA